VDLAGKKFGNYRAVSLIGEGGFGAVYLAEHPLMSRKAAVKVLRPARAADMEFLTRFFNEARAASAINHPNIVEIFDAGVTEEGTPYLLMELLQGETLKDRLVRGGVMSPAVALGIAVPCASALAAAHRAGIVHRDFKPENVFLATDPPGGSSRSGRGEKTSSNERVKILDFGIAKLTGFGTANVARTEVGTFMGSPRYVSPEQWLGTHEVDHRTDVYALTAVLFEMLTGAPPFVADDLVELRQMHLTTTPPRLAERGLVGVAPELETAIARGLAKEPADRFASAEEMGTVLARLLGVAPALTSVPRVPISRPTEPLFGGAAATGTTLGGSAGESTGDASVPDGDDDPGDDPARRGRRVLRLGMAAILGVAAAVVGGLLITSGRSRQDAGGGTVPGPPAPASHKLAAPGPVPSDGLGNPVIRAQPAVGTTGAGGRGAPVSDGGLVLQIRTRPPGATVIDEESGSVLGRTPIELRFASGEEPRRLRLSRRGFRSVSFEPGTGEPRRGGDRPAPPRQILKDVTLRPAPAPSSPTPPEGDIVL
jgi:serine/threonine-protein kinase